MTSPSIANAISTLTMSSREIAKLTGKQHRNVMRDATNMLTELYDVRDTLKFEHIYSDTMNRKQTEPRHLGSVAIPPAFGVQQER